MADTYSTILSVAKSLFVKQGHTATSMRQVAGKDGDKVFNRELHE